MIYFLKLIRWPNLVMTILALWIHWYFLIYLSLNSRHAVSKMDHTGIFLLGLAFAFVMGAGYVINDIFDQDIDTINKGKAQILINHISVQSAKRYYWMLNGAAGLLSIFLAKKYDQFNYLILLPIAIALLYFYSSALKKKGLIGNLVIAILCGAVLLLPFWFEQKQLQDINLEFHSVIRTRFFICFAVASLLTLIRELIKDQEDEPGDRAAKAATFPITWGSANTDVFIKLLTGLCVIIILFSWRFVNAQSLISTGLLLSLGIAILIFFILQLLNIYRTNYTVKSKYLKFLMVLGMIFLPIALKIV